MSMDTGKIQIELGKYGLTPQIITCIQNTGISQLHEDQMSALKKGLLRKRSFLISTPSGSGKTLSAEIAAVHTILTHHGKSLFLVPLRALAYEKFAYFQQVYSSLGIYVRIAVGDQELSKNDLRKADLLIMTYEKFDAYLRSQRDFDWIHCIQTVIIDEIHVLGEQGRGPRLENLIIRIYRLPDPPQLVTLSATIANPEEILKWFEYLEMKYRNQPFQCVVNSIRPIKLHYSIVRTHNKIQKISEICKKILKNKGKVLIFTNSRRDTELLSEELASLLFSPHDYLSRSEILLKIKANGRNSDTISTDLIDRLVYRVAYHHAGLNTTERTLIEDFFRSDLLHILCCTNTLSAGINTPAQAVILKEYEVYSPNPIHDPKSPQSKKFLKSPIDKNLFHQICGRAGRPGFDETGLVFIIAPNNENKGWIEDKYFKRDKEGRLSPQYNNLTSTFSQNSALLQEIVLLKIFETQQFHMGKFIDFIQDSLLWHQMSSKNFPLEAYFNLQRLNFTILLKAFGQRLHFLIQKLVKIRLLIKKFIPNQKIIVELSLIPRSQSKFIEIKKYLKKTSPMQQKYWLDAIREIESHSYNNEVEFSMKAGKKCSCKINPDKNIYEISHFSKPLRKFCLDQSFVLYALNHVVDNLLFEIDIPSSITVNYGGFKEVISQYSSEVEHFIYRSLFPPPIFEILTKYGLIHTNVGIINQIKTTPLGKIGLQSYILPKTVDYLNHQLRVRLDQGYQLTLQQIFPIFQYIFNSRGIKSNPFIFESFLLWMEENEMKKIVRTLNQNPSLRILYKNDFTILIDTTSRILKFIHKFIENFYPDYEKQQIYSLYYRIRFGILPDLIPWAKMYKNENPRIFRSLIQEGFSDPDDLRKIPDISLSKFLNVSVSKARRLKQEIAVSLELT